MIAFKTQLFGKVLTLNPSKQAKKNEYGNQLCKETELTKFDLQDAD